MAIAYTNTSRALRILLVGASLLLATPGAAADLSLSSGIRQNTLIELYTSQGCSSCPPAERWLGSLQDDPRLWRQLIPLAFHVDYWDYIGWKDELARAAFSERQRRYHQEGALSAVYTPGFVVNGREWRRWFGLRDLPVSNVSTGQLTLELKGEKLRAAYVPVEPVKGALLLNVAVLGVGLTATVTRGENAGKRLPQDFVVLEHMQSLSAEGHWESRLPRLSPTTGERLAIVAWVSRQQALAPLQAVGGWLGPGN